MHHTTVATEAQRRERQLEFEIQDQKEAKERVRIPVAGRVCAYALDPHEVWKGYDNAKGYAAFVSKTLVNQDGDIKRRIMSMFSPDERPKEPVE